MQDVGDYGETLARRFRAEASHLKSDCLRKARLSVTRVRRDTAGHGWVDPCMDEPAFSVSLQLRAQEKRELYIRGKLAHRGGYGARTTSIVDHQQEPRAFLGSPFDTLHFYVSRAALDAIAYERGARRVETLTCERGVLDETIWHLGSALLPALERPHEVSTLYADQMLLATHLYFATAFGGLRVDAVPRRAQLTSWQLRRAREVMLNDLAEDISLAVPAAACGLSESYFSRAFKASVGEPPHRWLLRQKVERARDLLLHSGVSLPEIALMCGFADQSHFTRVFRQYTGSTPGRWRRHNSL